MRALMNSLFAGAGETLKMQIGKWTTSMRRIFLLTFIFPVLPSSYFSRFKYFSAVHYIGPNFLTRHFSNKIPSNRNVFADRAKCSRGDIFEAKLY